MYISGYFQVDRFNRIGDVVLYSARDLQGKVVTTWAHRIIAGDGIKGFTIKGDANAAPDVNIVPSSDIKSIMFFISFKSMCIKESI